MTARRAGWALLALGVCAVLGVSALGLVHGAVDDLLLGIAVGWLAVATAAVVLDARRDARRRRSGERTVVTRSGSPAVTSRGGRAS